MIKNVLAMIGLGTVIVYLVKLNDRIVEKRVEDAMVATRANPTPV